MITDRIGLHSVNKLTYYGIVNIENNWFRSHPNNMKQKVYINEVMSDLHQISPGVPQEFILGPLLF